MREGKNHVAYQVCENWPYAMPFGGKGCVAQPRCTFCTFSTNEVSVFCDTCVIYVI